MTSQASATREAPAQAELRPTCAGAPRVNPSPGLSFLTPSGRRIGAKHIPRVFPADYALDRRTTWLLLDIERELILIEQTPGEIVFLSAADTDLSCVASVWRERFGKRLRIAHAFSLRQPVAADHYIETVLRKSKLVVARLLGGRAYFVTSSRECWI